MRRITGWLQREPNNRGGVFLLAFSAFFLWRAFATDASGLRLTFYALIAFGCVVGGAAELLPGGQRPVTTGLRLAYLVCVVAALILIVVGYLAGA
ncbi:MAG: hypothetical protein M3506_03780 [Chloroflexota bacterium]|nr:hypothetical protein [Chloroflexota bacterium]